MNCQCDDFHQKIFVQSLQNQFLWIVEGHHRVDHLYFVKLQQCGTNIIFLDEWISEYIRYHRYWTNEYPNIFGMIKISRMNIRINLPMKKSTNIFANEYICPKYSNVFEYQIIFPRLFWTILAIFICFVILYPYWTIFDQ